jgi:hypothetical protein
MGDVRSGGRISSRRNGLSIYPENRVRNVGHTGKSPAAAIPQRGYAQQHLPCFVPTLLTSSAGRPFQQVRHRDVHRDPPRFILAEPTKFELVINLTIAKAAIESEWQKGLDFGRKRSVSVAAIYGSVGPSWIPPRWRCRHCGASVVTALDAVVTEKGFS